MPRVVRRAGPPRAPKSHGTEIRAFRLSFLRRGRSSRANVCRERRGSIVINKLGRLTCNQNARVCTHMLARPRYGRNVFFRRTRRNIIECRYRPDGSARVPARPNRAFGSCFRIKQQLGPHGRHPSVTDAAWEAHNGKGPREMSGKSTENRHAPKRTFTDVQFFF